MVENQSSIIEIEEINRLLNPIDRSQGRFDKILEYVKKHSELEYWEQTNGKGRHIWIKCVFPYHPSPKRNAHYSEVFLYNKIDGFTSENEAQKKEEGTQELYNKLAEKIFNEN